MCLRITAGICAAWTVWLFYIYQNGPFVAPLRALLDSIPVILFFVAMGAIIHIATPAQPARHASVIRPEARIPSNSKSTGTCQPEKAEATAVIHPETTICPIGDNLKKWHVGWLLGLLAVLILVAATCFVNSMTFKLQPNEATKSKILGTIFASNQVFQQGFLSGSFKLAHEGGIRPYGAISEFEFYPVPNDAAALHFRFYHGAIGRCNGRFDGKYVTLNKLGIFERWNDGQNNTQ